MLEITPLYFPVKSTYKLTNCLKTLQSVLNLGLYYTLSSVVYILNKIFFNRLPNIMFVYQYSQLRINVIS